jgi:Replication-relaxation
LGWLTVVSIPGGLLLSSSSRPASADRARVVRPRRRPDPNCAALADIDRRVLAILCKHRVVRQDQLQRLLSDIPARTLRYRTRRLHDLGLVGRSRPYRELGSAPNHHWPTRRADCVMNGNPIPRGGERDQPNPLFLAHAAALTELYVTLAVEAPAAGLSLFDYRREAGAREPFKRLGKERALAPDAMVILTDGQERKLGAFVELDLGTMSHTRLRQKADLYVAYALADAWHDRHPFLPALLFLTTTDARARRFLAAFGRALSHGPRDNSRRTFVAGAGELAFEPGPLLSKGCLTDLDGCQGLRLLDVLNAARAPYDQALAQQRERRETEEAERERLLEEPEAMREHLRVNERSLSPCIQAFNPLGQQALKLLIASEDRLLTREREVMRSLARDLGDALLEPGMQTTLPSPGELTIAAMELLAGCYRAGQGERVQALVTQHGEGPQLRRMQEHLQQGRLLDSRQLSRLQSDAERDAQGREEQRQRKTAYLEWRDGAARQFVRRSGPVGRLTRSKEEFYPQLDRRLIRTCRECREPIYPRLDDEPGGAKTAKPGTCHFCGGVQYLTRPHTERTGSR